MIALRLPYENEGQDGNDGHERITDASGNGRRIKKAGKVRFVLHVSDHDCAIEWVQRVLGGGAYSEDLLPAPRKAEHTAIASGDPLRKVCFHRSLLSAS